MEDGSKWDEAFPSL